MAENQRRAGVILGYANIVTKNIVNLLYTPMLLSFVGKGDFGVFQTSNSFIYSLTILSFGFSGAYVRFYTQRKALDDEYGIRVLNGMYLILYLIICTVAIIGGLILASNVGLVFSAKFTSREVDLASKLMTIMSFNIAVTLLSTVFDANVIVHEEFRFQQSRQLFTTLITPVMALSLLFFGFGAVGVAFAQLLVSLTLLFLNAHFAIVKLGMRFELSSFDTNLFRAVAAFSAWLFANQICDLVNQNVPNVILGAKCGAAVVAVFAVSVQIRQVFISLSTTLSSMFVPQVNRIVAEGDDNEKLTRVMTRVGRYQMAILAWVYGGFAVLGEFFIAHWAGKGFSEAYWMVLVMVGPLLVPLSQNVGIEIQKAKNMHRARSIVLLLMAVLNVAFSFFMSPLIGYWATAAAYVCSIFAGNCLFMNWYYHARVGLDMTYYWRQMFPIMLSCVASTALCLAGTKILAVNSWVRFLVWGASYTVLYIVAVWTLVLNNDEKQSVTSKMGVGRRV